MTYWAIESENNDIGIFLEKDYLLAELIRDGLNPETVRSVLRSDADGGLYFKVLIDDQEMNSETLHDLPDFMIWAWVPVMSQRVMELALEGGGEINDFLPCQLSGFDSKKFYLHLPKTIYDILDFSCSTFEINIPINPPLLQRLLVAKFSESPENLPSVFRLLSRNNGQVLDDLLVDDEFKSKWEARGLAGGQFREIK